MFNRKFKIRKKPRIGDVHNSILTKIGKACYNIYMKTINVSLTTEQFDFVDSTTAKLGFANRSEFVRAILRLIVRKPEVLEESGEIIFQSPPTKSRKKIINSFRATKKYSDAFLKDLDDGLKDSSYFK